MKQRTSSSRWMMSVVVAACACGVDEPVTETATSAVVAAHGQGTRFQGTDFQGTRFQGTRFQGTRFQGTRFQGASLGGTALGDARIAGSSLWVWSQRPDLTWEQRFPGQICYWNAARTVRTSCAIVDLASAPSPLTGVSFPATFVTTTTPSVTFTANLQIGASSSAIGAVVQDTDLALFALTGSDAATRCMLVPQGQSCTNPGGCLTNCDVWKYDVRLIDKDGTQIALCGPGESAIALSGIWDQNGQHAPDSNQFTFACTGGTIAKCTRWGYRPWESAVMSDGTRLDLAPYHQACVRAAAAAYCGTDTSFTRDGTLVDVYDWNANSSGHFIARTTSALVGQPVTAFLWESNFDGHGATQIDHTRYANISSLSDPTQVCPGMFAPDGDVCGGTTNDCWDRTFGPWGPELVAIQSATACSHSESTPGIWLDQACSACANRVAYSGSYVIFGLVVHPYLYCSQPSGKWDAACVAQAKALCTPPFTPMMSHSECTVGAGLSPYGTACTLLLHALATQDPPNPSYAPYATCTSSWTQACVSGASALCSGGQEVINRVGQRVTGFCGSTIPTTLQP